MHKTSRWAGVRDASPEREVYLGLTAHAYEAGGLGGLLQPEGAVQVPRKVFDYGLVENVLVTVTVTLLDDGVEV